MRQSSISDGNGRLYETPLDRKLFLLSPSISLHRSIAKGYFLERENVKESLMRRDH